MNVSGILIRHQTPRLFREAAENVSIARSATETNERQRFSPRLIIGLMLLGSLTTECAFAQTYLSDMAWTSAVSGWGPVEKDKTNGDQGSGDGGPLILNGVTFAKGLGAHANSDIRYNLAGSCSTFSAQVGVDDDAGNNGSIVFQVLADGVKIYDSGPVYGWGATQSVNVSVAGKNELALIINDAGNGAAWDHGDWADAKVTCNGTPPSSGGQYLSDMTWTSATNGWGPVERDRSNGDLGGADGRVITINGRTYAKGLGVHANSDIRFALSGGCSTFTADVGVDDEAGVNGSIIFQVLADGVKIYDSGPVYGWAGSQSVNVSIAGRTQLALIVVDGGGGLGWDHGDWADAKVNCSGSNPAPPPTSNYVPSAPIVLSGRNGATISGVSITNPNGPCITVTGSSQNIRIENSELGPCLGGILVEGATNVTMDNLYIHDMRSNGNAIDVTFSQNVAITNSRMEYVRTGIYALRSTGMRIERNRFLNVVGPLPRGQFVQFNHVYGAGNRIFCNSGENVLGESYVVEAINLYDSFGEANDPIQIVGNKIKGGGPSGSSGAILLGDAGGAYQVARDNIIVDPGQQGIGVGGGHDISVLNNLIYAKQQSFTNVGLYVWNQDSSQCYNITVQGNQVNWTASNGTKNPSWDAGNCGPVAGWNSNNFSAAFDANALLNTPIAACSQ